MSKFPVTSGFVYTTLIITPLSIFSKSGAEHLTFVPNLPPTDLRHIIREKKILTWLWNIGGILVDLWSQPQTIKSHDTQTRSRLSRTFQTRPNVRLWNSLLTHASMRNIRPSASAFSTPMWSRFPSLLLTGFLFTFLFFSSKLFLLSSTFP